MKKKITLSTAVTLILLTAALTISVTMLVAIRYFNRQVQSVSQRQAMYTHINDVDKKVREYYPKLDEELLQENLTAGYVKGIGDSDAAYFTAAQYVKEQQRLSGNANDVGITVCVNASGLMTVASVNTDSAAAKAGVKRGDTLLAIDGAEVVGRTAADVQKQLNAAEKVMIRVQRGGEALAYELAAYPYTLRSVQSTMLDTVAYIRITGFYENTPSQFKSILSALSEQDVSGYIFDLRNNVGGSLEAAKEIISYLVPLGKYGYVTNADGTVTNLTAESTSPLSVSTGTLINHTTAGEAEFFAGVLQDMSLTTVVGETSAGKAKVQEYLPLEANGSAIKLTVGQYSRLKSGTWQDKGIVPDATAVLTTEQQAIFPLLDTANDPQVKVALVQIGR